MLLVKSGLGWAGETTGNIWKDQKFPDLSSFDELRTLRLCLAGRHHEGDAHQLEQGLALLHVLLPHLDAGLEKTRVKKKQSSGFFGVYLVFLGVWFFWGFLVFLKYLPRRESF